MCSDTAMWPEKRSHVLWEEPRASREEWGDAQPSLQAERQVAAPEAKSLDCQDALASLAGLANIPAFEVRTNGR